MNTKEQKIKEAYGEYWETVKDYVDENGYYDPILNTMTLQKDLEIFKFCNKFTNKNGVTAIYQPKSLSGIENNNGWIRIESEADLPNDGWYSYICCKIMTDGVFNIYNEIFDVKKVKRYFNLGLISHYRKYEFKKPIY